MHIILNHCLMAIDLEHDMTSLTQNFHIACPQSCNNEPAGKLVHDLLLIVILSRKEPAERPLDPLDS